MNKPKQAQDLIDHISMFFDKKPKTFYAEKVAGLVFNTQQTAADNPYTPVMFNQTCKRVVFVVLDEDSE